MISNCFTSTFFRDVGLQVIWDGHFTLELMSLLNEIIQKVSSGQRHTEEWLVLRNSYFRGTDPIEDMQTWADKNEIDLLIRYKERSLHAVIVESVTFLPKKKAR